MIENVSVSDTFEKYWYCIVSVHRYIWQKVAVSAHRYILKVSTKGLVTFIHNLWILISSMSGTNQTNQQDRWSNSSFNLRMFALFLLPCGQRIWTRWYCYNRCDGLQRRRGTLSKIRFSSNQIMDICLFEFYFQIMKSLRFCKIERTDRVPAAHAVRLVLPLQGNVNEV